MSAVIRDALRDFIGRELMIGEDTPISDDDGLLVEGIIDSLGVVRLVGFIETELGVRIPPEEVIVENFATIGALADHITSRNGASSG
ncbi:MAG TPA: acyl carrier protein [Acidimicrobiia bacterium]|nr:acyl carrier protein [Acidimicrobiia bacterium]